jgi:hypothetical protein
VDSLAYFLLLTGLDNNYFASDLGGGLPQLLLVSFVATCVIAPQQKQQERFVVVEDEF